MMRCCAGNKGSSWSVPRRTDFEALGWSLEIVYDTGQAIQRVSCGNVAIVYLDMQTGY